MSLSHRLETDVEQFLSLTVLLIDDAEVDRQVYRRYLETDATVKYRYLEAETLEEGLALYRQEKPDVTLLDFSLPDGDGLEFLALINQASGGVKLPVVMLTGQGDERIAATAIKLGAADYLVKQDLTATALQIAVVQNHHNGRLKQQLEETQQRETITSEIALRIRQSLDLQTILDAVVQEIWKYLKTDRVLIYQLIPDVDTSGAIVAEAVSDPWEATIHQQVKDTCLTAARPQTELYRHGHVFFVNNVDDSSLTDCHKQLLQRFQVKANLVVPIVLPTAHPNGGKLWGLLIAHHCATPRQWNSEEIHLLKRLSVQLAIAIQQAELYQSLQQLNHDLLETNLQLRQATRLKDEFLANMSHELRTPLTAILGMSEILLEGIYDPLNTHQTKATNTITRSAQHLLGLINEILDLAKIESGKMQLEPEPCYLAALCEDCLQFVRSQANKKNLSLGLDVTTTVSRVELDSRRLRQALINLLSNAVKFTPEGGSVKLQVEQVDAWLNFHVIDTGIGIDPGDRHKLFQPFIQLDSQLNRQYEGTGLGLALVKRIAELHQGTISFTSVLRQGSRFTLAIPYKPLPELSESPAVSGETPQSLSIPPTQKAIRLLIADDDANTVATLEDYLSPQGYQLCFADNGVTAINQIYQEHPDLVILDIQMPVMDGWDTIAHIRRDPTLQGLPIIVATALAMPEDQEKCLATGATAYISKPVRLRRLERLIRETLAKSMQSSPSQSQVPPLTSSKTSLQTPKI